MKFEIEIIMKRESGRRSRRRRRRRRRREREEEREKRRRTTTIRKMPLPCNHTEVRAAVACHRGDEVQQVIAVPRRKASSDETSTFLCKRFRKQVRYNLRTRRLTRRLHSLDFKLVLKLRIIIIIIITLQYH